MSVPVTTTMFGSLVQHFWFTVALLVSECEKIWLERFKSVSHLSDGWTMEHFLQTICAHMKLKRAQIGIIPSDKIGPTYWFNGILLAHWQHMCSSGNSSSSSDAANLAASRALLEPLFTQFAQSFEPEIVALQKFIVAKAKKKPAPASARRKLQPLELPFKKLWRVLCDGASQQMLTCAFAFALAEFPAHNAAPIRWSFDAEWYLCDIHIIDGVFVNATECIVDCPKREQRKHGQLCDQLHCWRRPHSWLLLSFIDPNTQRIRSIHVDICSAALGRYDDKRLGDIPLHVAFSPVVWTGADFLRDPAPFISRREPLATYDQRLWETLAAKYALLDDESIEERRVAGKFFYAVSGQSRMRHAEQWFQEIHATLDLIPKEIAQISGGVIDPALPPMRGEQIVERLRAEISYMELERRRKIVSTGDKFRQLLISAAGIKHIAAMFVQCCQDPIDGNDIIEFEF